MTIVNYLRNKSVFIFIFISLAGTACRKKLKQVPSLKPEKAKYEFYDSTYFSFCWTIEKHKKTFFIDDYKNNRVLKLNSSINLIKSFGRFGHGPGEFQGAGSVIINHDSLYIYDDAGIRFNVYSTSGKFIRAFQIPYRLNWARVASIGNRLFMSSPFIKGYSSPIFETDLKGNLIRFFDEDTTDNLKHDSENRLLFSSPDSTQIISIPIGEPFVERYTIEGKFIGSFDLRKIKKLKQLWDFYENKAKKNNSHTTQVLFEDASIEGSYIYILCSPWEGRDDYSYIIKLQVSDNSFKPETVFKIQGTEPSMSLFGRLSVSGNNLIATEGFSNTIFKFDLSTL